MKRHHSKPKSATKRRRGLPPSGTPQEVFEYVLAKLRPVADRIYINVRHNLKHGASAERYGFIVEGDSVGNCLKCLFDHYMKREQAEMAVKQIKAVRFDIPNDLDKKMYSLVPRTMKDGGTAKTEKPSIGTSASLQKSIAGKSIVTDAAGMSLIKTKVEEANASLKGTGFTWWIREGFSVCPYEQSIGLWYEATENSPDHDIYPDGEDVAAAYYDHEHNLWIGRTDSISHQESISREEKDAKSDNELSPFETVPWLTELELGLSYYALYETGKLCLHKDIGELLAKLSAWALESKDARILYRFRMKAAREAMGIDW